jgi:tRNA uracil 4-sulfurtransferase
MNSIVVHYNELALKGRNRPWFVHMLVRNIRTALAGLSVPAVRSVMGRIEIELGPAGWEAVRERLKTVFGIQYYSYAGSAPLDLDEIASTLIRDLGDRSPSSFRVTARRADKRFPLTSPQIEFEIGGRIKEAKGWRVDLSHPELTVHVDLMSNYAFYFFGKEPGAGGLPTGTGGRVACLLSGGIDSPVAAYRLMRRGCSVLLVHFHSYPVLSRASQEKVRELAAILTLYQQRSRLILVPFADIQRQVLLTIAPELRVVMYRRLMMRITERLARRWDAKALVTGEVIGQVASQTLDNLTTIGGATKLQVLRPLIGMDKDEITVEAKRIGTFPISIIPDQDCCTLFTPKHPATHVKPRQIEDAEALLPIAALVDSAVAAAEVEEFTFALIKYPAGSSVRLQAD